VRLGIGPKLRRRWPFPSRVVAVSGRRPNAASPLYGALCRAAKALGYRRAIEAA
jgi:hypothetical protein